MNEPRKTVFYDRHVAAGARMVDFAGWLMPVQYPAGIVAEHLLTRSRCGLFDVSHMGRFALRGGGAERFLRHVLTNDAAALRPGESHYTLLASPSGGAVDDAWLYRLSAGEFLLVVNASNRAKDWDWLRAAGGGGAGAEMTDESDRLAMLAVQGPLSEEILAGALTAGALPESRRNALSAAAVGGVEVRVARTGYAGERRCFELFFAAADGPAMWDLLVARGAAPVGLGARDTLRLEAGLPLYGHELGAAPDGREIPILASPSSRFGVDLSPGRGDFIGREALEAQHQALEALAAGPADAPAAVPPEPPAALPRRIVPVAVLGPGVARAGAEVFRYGGRLDRRGAKAEAGGTPAAPTVPAGYVTSGTMVPYQRPGGEKGMRAIALALLDSRLTAGDQVEIDIRGRRVLARIVSRHLAPAPAGRTRPVLHTPDQPSP